MNICYSGGAIGADLAWGNVAAKRGHAVVHYVFEGHKAEKFVSAIVLRDEQLRLADPFLKQANKTLGRSWPVRALGTANLLRRNYYQIKDTDAVYAISTFKDGKVDGGTAWAVQMFIDRHHANACPCYVFDQNIGQWYEWKGQWVAVDSVPAPSGKYTGIGTRKLNTVGLDAINTVY